MAVALFALIGVCSFSLRQNKQSMASIGATQVADGEMGRIVSQIIADVGGRKTTVWGSDHSYPSNPLEKGTRTVGRDTFNFAIYEQDLAGVGSAANKNRCTKIDVYVWWREPNEAGGKRTSCSRLFNEGETQ